MIERHEKFAGLKGMLENVAYITSTALMEPAKEWKPPVLNQELFVNGKSSFNDVFPAELKPENYDDYFSEDIHKESKKIQPKREGIVKLVLEKIPLDPVKWFVLHSSLITRGSFINRMLLPKGWNSYALSLRYSFNIRERSEKDFMQILRKTLADSDIIASS